MADVSIVEELIKNGDLEGIKTLVSDKKLLKVVGDSIYYDKFSVLHMALRRFLFSKTAEPAFTDSSYQVLEFILETYPELVNKTYYVPFGLEPLRLALFIYYFNPEACCKVVKLLMEYGADPEMEFPEKGTILEHYEESICVPYGHDQYIASINEILKGGGIATKDARK